MGKTILRLTTDDLRGIPPKASCDFHLPDNDSVRRGRLLAHAQARALHCRFATRSNYIDNILTITKIPQP